MEHGARGAEYGKGSVGRAVWSVAAGIAEHGAWSEERLQRDWSMARSDGLLERVTEAADHLRQLLQFSKDLLFGRGVHEAVRGEKQKHAGTLED